MNTAGEVETVVTGLAWRRRVCQQVFEEAAVDLVKGLRAWSDSRAGNRNGRQVGFPGFKKKRGSRPSFRLRNKHAKDEPSAIRVGGSNGPRTVTLPGIGQIAVRDDTRRLRRMFANNRAKILSATIVHRGGRWWLSINVEAADLHPSLHHLPRADGDDSGWVGIDRGLSAFIVGADIFGREVIRICNAPKPLVGGIKRQRQLASSLSRKQKGSHIVTTRPINSRVTTFG